MYQRKNSSDFCVVFVSVSHYMNALSKHSGITHIFSGIHFEDNEKNLRMSTKWCFENEQTTLDNTKQRKSRLLGQSNMPLLCDWNGRELK